MTYCSLLQKARVERRLIGTLFFHEKSMLALVNMLMSSRVSGLHHIAREEHTA